jgi:hypothetical protein
MILPLFWKLPTYGIARFCSSAFIVLAIVLEMHLCVRLTVSFEK